MWRCALIRFLLPSVIAAGFIPGCASQQRLTDDQYHNFERQTIKLEPFATPGPVLDIGGGGEGVIGQLLGSKVVAIDLSEEELRDAPGQPLLKIVMDARDLKFMPESFPDVTVFFTFMYINGNDHDTVFRQIHRVLKPGGTVRIWDVNFGPRPAPHIRGGIFRLQARLPGKDINTGYGVRWPEQLQTLAQYIQRAEACGFTVSARQDAGVWFYLELKKAAR